MWSGKNEDEEQAIAAYLHIFREKIYLVRELANKRREKRESTNSATIKKATERRFGVGNNLLVFQPKKLDKLHNEWQGLVTVMM